MAENEIQLDGDPRKLAMAIFRAARETCDEKHGRQRDWNQRKSALEAEIPKLARQMVEALEGDVRDTYLMNALEVMAITYAKQESKRRG